MRRCHMKQRPMSRPAFPLPAPRRAAGPRGRGQHQLPVGGTGRTGHPKAGAPRAALVADGNLQDRELPADAGAPLGGGGALLTLRYLESSSTFCSSCVSSSLWNDLSWMWRKTPGGERPGREGGSRPQEVHPGRRPPRGARGERPTVPAFVTSGAPLQAENSKSPCEPPALCPVLLSPSVRPWPPGESAPQYVTPVRPGIRPHPDGSHMPVQRALGHTARAHSRLFPSLGPAAPASVPSSPGPSPSLPADSESAGGLPPSERERLLQKHEGGEDTKERKGKFSALRPLHPPVAEEQGAGGRVQGPGLRVTSRQRCGDGAPGNGRVSSDGGCPTSDTDHWGLWGAWVRVLKRLHQTGSAQQKQQAAYLQPMSEP